MKEGNSYTKLLKLMKNQGYNKDVSIVIGKVKSTSPLEIDLGDFTLSQDDIFITETLAEHERKVDLSGSGVNVSNGNLTVKSSMKVGDRLLVLIDNNDFYVIDRVVSL
jgi:Protein of unknown function (DUF2577)